jgi:hypothetical protein
LNTLKVLTYNFVFFTLGSNLENKSNLSKFYENMPLWNSIKIEGIKNFKESLDFYFGTGRYWGILQTIFLCAEEKFKKHLQILFLASDISVLLRIKQSKQIRFFSKSIQTPSENSDETVKHTTS